MRCCRGSGSRRGRRHGSRCGRGCGAERTTGISRRGGRAAAATRSEGKEDGDQRAAEPDASGRREGMMHGAGLEGRGLRPALLMNGSAVAACAEEGADGRQHTSSGQPAPTVERPRVGNTAAGANATLLFCYAVPAPVQPNRRKTPRRLARQDAVSSPAQRALAVKLRRTIPAADVHPNRPPTHRCPALPGECEKLLAQERHEGSFRRGALLIRFDLCRGSRRRPTRPRKFSA